MEWIDGSARARWISKSKRTFVIYGKGAWWQCGRSLLEPNHKCKQTNKHLLLSYITLKANNNQRFVFSPVSKNPEPATTWYPLPLGVEPKSMPLNNQHV
jgi:hypothetical protein